MKFPWNIPTRLSLALLLFVGACAAPAGQAAGDGDGDTLPGDGDGDSFLGSGGSANGPSAGGTGSSAGGTTGDTGGGENGSGGSLTISGSAEIGLPFSEDFEDGAANGFIADVDDELAPLGSWSIVDDGGNQVYQQSQATDDPTWAVGGDFHWTDQRFETRFKISSGIDEVYLFIAARLLDFDHYYYLEIRDDRIKLRVRNDGNADIIEWDIPVPMIEGEWHTVALSAVGTTLTVEFDGMVVMTTTNAELTNGGIGVGVRDGTVVFDDLSVTAP
jgi:hypothetical protein